MIIHVKDVVVSDRIRSDYGDLQTLADDIRKNGLINPITITPNFELIAGGRRFFACRDILGWKNIEAIPIAVRDFEHQLDIEISENLVRKNWTRTEMLEIAIRKERVAAIKGKENQRTKKTRGYKRILDSDRVNSAEEAAKSIGVSRNTYHRMKSIVEDKEFLTDDDFERWNKKAISTNWAYQKIQQNKQRFRAGVDDQEELKNDMTKFLDCANKFILEFDNIDQIEDQLITMNNDNLQIYAKICMTLMLLDNMLKNYFELVESSYAETLEPLRETGVGEEPENAI